MFRQIESTSPKSRRSPISRKLFHPRFLLNLALVALVFAIQPVASALSAERVFEVTLPADARLTAPNGRLLVFLSGRPRGDVPLSPSWFNPEPFFGIDIQDWEPGTTRNVDDSALGFPGKLSELAPGTYRAAAVYDTDFYYPDPGSGTGNYYSATISFEVKADEDLIVPFTLDRVIEETPWPDSPFVVKYEKRSELLSQFHGRDVLDRAAVVLPASYFDQPDRRYPVVYVVSGFGGHLPQMAQNNAAPREAGPGEVEFIRVLLSGECKWGHHVYADSATNGPRGQALIEEMIPAIDAQFRTVADMRARFVMGHSSGGWSSLWLQVTYPETFGGVWSSSPDPVDFRDYQRTNLYANPAESVYYEANGDRKPLARNGETPMIWYPDFGRMDDVLGRGGQLRSFEAVFSPLDDAGQPALMWHRTTGKVDLQVTEVWKKYDISLTLRENWPSLQESLQGKLHVIMGTLDTFYLDGATVLLGKELERLGSDARVELVEGADHGSVLSAEYRQRQRREMSQVYLQFFTPEGERR